MKKKNEFSVLMKRESISIVENCVHDELFPGFMCYQYLEIGKKNSISEMKGWNLSSWNFYFIFLLFFIIDDIESG